jgi:hypothetical protein
MDLIESAGRDCADKGGARGGRRASTSRGSRADTVAQENMKPRRAQKCGLHARPSDPRKQIVT